MKSLIWAAGLGLATVLAARGANTGIDPANRYVWAENAGWVSFAPSNTSGVILHFDGNQGHLTGYAWGENVGWIKLGDDTGGPYGNTGAADWGVNVDAAGNLSGYAWGENIGWINFNHPQCDAAIQRSTGTFTGHAWGENIGWIKMSGTGPTFGARTVAFDRQAQGTPNWWLDLHGVGEGHDAGDGVPAWQKYVMDVDPVTAWNFLRISAISNAPVNRAIAFTPASSRRFYTLVRREDMTTGAWSNVVGQVGIAGVDGVQVLQDTNAPPGVFYGVKVTESP